MRLRGEQCFQNSARKNRNNVTTDRTDNTDRDVIHRGAREDAIGAVAIGLS